MEKINSLGIERTGHHLRQEMQRMSAMAGGNVVFSQPTGQFGQASNVSFSQVFNGAINHVDRQQHKANDMQTAIDMGQSDDLMGTMVESQKASISFAAMMEVRNKLTTALDQIMSISL